jgi:hypothetical protein
VKLGYLFSFSLETMFATNYLEIYFFAIEMGEIIEGFNHTIHN